MKTHTKAEVTVSLSEDDIERLLDEGKIKEDGVTIEVYP